MIIVEHTSSFTSFDLIAIDGELPSLIAVTREIREVMGWNLRNSLAAARMAFNLAAVGETLNLVNV